MRTVRLDDFMPRRLPSVNPAKFQSETFELWSVPSFDLGTPEILQGSEIGSSKKVVESGDLLLSRIVPHIRRAWIVEPTTDNRQIGSGEWITFRGEDFHAPYLRHILISDRFNAQLMQTIAGVGGSLLRARPESVREIEIPLPPLPEQKRIAAILDQADALRKHRQRALDHLNQLGQSIFYEMFGEAINTKGENINRVTIDDVCSIKGGGTPSKANAEYYTGDIPWVSPKDMKFWEIETAKDKITQEAVKKSATNLIPTDSILVVNRSGILKHTVPIGITKNPVAINQDIKALIPNSKVTTVFLAHLLKFFEPKILTWVRATTADNFQLQQLKQLAFNLPLMSKQKKFGELYNETSRLLQVAETQLKETESLFASLQQRTFRGEL